MEARLSTIDNKLNTEYDKYEEISRSLKYDSIDRAEKEIDKLWSSFKAAKNSLKVTKQRYETAVKELKKLRRANAKIVKAEDKKYKQILRLQDKRIKLDNKLVVRNMHLEIKQYDTQDKEDQKKEKMSNKLWKRIQLLPRDLLWAIKEFYMTTAEQNRLMAVKLKRTILPRLVKETFPNMITKIHYFLYHISTAYIFDKNALITLSQQVVKLQEQEMIIPPDDKRTLFFINSPIYIKSKMRILLREVMKSNPPLATQILKLYLILAQDKYKIP